MALVSALVGPGVPWADLAPILVLVFGACFLLLVGSLTPVWPRHGYAWFTGAVGSVAIILNCIKWNDLYYEKGRILFGDSIAIDRFSVLATITILGALVLSCFLMSAYVSRMNSDGPELFALMLTATIGAVVMVVANDLIVLFLVSKP